MNINSNYQIKDIKKWPQVENGAYSRNLAQKVFNRLFDEGVGRDRMKIWSKESKY